eukprot:jgi/Mesen1/753/ME000110S_11019
MKLDNGSVQLESAVDERERKSREYLRRRERQLDTCRGQGKGGGENFLALATTAVSFYCFCAIGCKTRRVGVMCMEDGVHRLIQELSKDYVPIMPYMPMLVEPRRWIFDNAFGAYNRFSTHSVLGRSLATLANRGAWFQRDSQRSHLKAQFSTSHRGQHDDSGGDSFALKFSDSDDLATSDGESLERSSGSNLEGTDSGVGSKGLPSMPTTSKPSDRHDLAIMFTCTVCETRSAKTMSRDSYENGVVIVQCPGCRNNHLIADRLGWFGENGDVEAFLAEKGIDVRKGCDQTYQFSRDDLTGWTPKA